MIHAVLANSLSDIFGGGQEPLWVRMLLYAGLLLLVLGMWMSIRKRRRRSGQPSLTPAEHLERARQLRGVRGDLEQIMVEVEQLARRMSAQLDAKTTELERLIRAADQRLDKLAQLSAPANDAPQAEGFSPGSAGPGARSQGPGISRPPTSNPQPAIAPQAHDPKASEIFALADRGVSSVDIARKLNEHVGKVELILALRRT